MNPILGSMRRIDENRGAVRVEDVYDTDSPTSGRPSRSRTGWLAGSPRSRAT